MSLSLQDKHILVTAGANGIGLAIVRKFWRPAPACMPATWTPTPAAPWPAAIRT